MHLAASLPDGLDFGMRRHIEARANCLHAFPDDLVITHDDRAHGRVAALPGSLGQLNAALHVKR